jgi:SPP1 gp7 family putative phage head morphogenesis protein
MKALKPIIESNSDVKMIESAIDSFLISVLYKPILDIIEKTINPKHYVNSSKVLLDAVRTQKIQYSNGVFTGSFNASISKELKAIGAKWSSSKKTWSLPLSKLPIDIRQVQAQVFFKFKKMNEEIQEYLKTFNMDEQLIRVNFVADYTNVIKGTEKAYQAMAKAVSIPVVMTEEAVKVIAHKYSNNMKIYIKDWNKQNIVKLRDKVQKNFNEGCRASNLVDIIQKNYGVSKNKAKFLARQETSLLTAEYTIQRYKDLGSKRWKWSTSHDSSVRPLHKLLDNQVFTYDSPPVIDERTGQKGFPRQAFGCRCKLLALI